MNLIPRKSREIAGPLASFQREMNRLFENFFGHDWGLTPFFRESTGWMPAVDVCETDDAVLVQAETPGLKPEDVEVTLVGNQLTIRGEKKEEKEDKSATYHRVERSYGAFERTFTLPEEVDSSKVDATFKNGVLYVKLPKKETAKSKAVKVKVRAE